MIKEVLLSITYAIVLLIVLALNSYATAWVINELFTPLFIWFYELNIIFKIIIILIGGSVVFGLITSVFSLVAGIISGSMSMIFPFSPVNYIISNILVGLNIILSLVELSKLFQWDFWIICIWLIMAWFIIQVNSIFVLKKFSYEDAGAQ